MPELFLEPQLALAPERMLMLQTEQYVLSAFLYSTLAVDLICNIEIISARHGGGRKHRLVAYQIWI